MKNKNENIPAIVKLAMSILSYWCELHPTCKNCDFRKKTHWLPIPREITKGIQKY